MREIKRKSLEIEFMKISLCFVMHYVSFGEEDRQLKALHRLLSITWYIQK
jgi:hypothetical protein